MFAIDFIMRSCTDNLYGSKTWLDHAMENKSSPDFGLTDDPIVVTARNRGR